MKVRVLVLLVAGILFLSPLAMAGDLGSADSDFLFSSEQVAATTISSEEMQSTQGQLLDNITLVILPLFSPIVITGDNSTVNACSTSLFGSGCTIVGVVSRVL